MVRLPLTLLPCALLLAGGCAGPLPTDPATAGNHPANPNAPTAPLDPPSQTLAIIGDAGATPLPTNRSAHVGPGGSDAPAPLPGESADQMTGMKGMGMGGPASATRPQGGAE